MQIIRGCSLVLVGSLVLSLGAGCEWNKYALRSYSYMPFDSVQVDLEFVEFFRSGDGDEIILARYTVANNSEGSFRLLLYKERLNATLNDDKYGVVKLNINGQETWGQPQKLALDHLEAMIDEVASGEVKSHNLFFFLAPDELGSGIKTFEVADFGLRPIESAEGDAQGG